MQLLFIPVRRRLSCQANFAAGSAIVQDNHWLRSHVTGFCSRLTDVRSTLTITLIISFIVL